MSGAVLQDIRHHVLHNDQAKVPRDDALLSMGMMMKNNSKMSCLIVLTSVFLLAGCPGSGDRLKADETTTVSKVGENICFQVPDARNYRPSLIAINPRGTPAQKLSATDSPDLAINNGELCIPPSFYHFPENGQYVVQYILEAPNERQSPRSVVAGIKFSDGRVENITLTDSETTR